ncbi:hypothetical protein AMAG_16057 [Allomyces macrogynus ATCC 38327]|uniref:Cyanovirin-N domain-containing protein n=1 Tax=Allomyces macrogynus (strain ATCC 38327) TaxID=578462 RepID=A0A0L0TAK5_ALLM3|nr:hypothetical protein AMAG_16057 [Allomyces macrogynus ATCC 38327]|eukprot:KNE71751.1 hypothetical protein AMAG_16057 [Allomyces macrogynus ATCC 38327]
MKQLGISTLVLLAIIFYAQTCSAEWFDNVAVANVFYTSSANGNANAGRCLDFASETANGQWARAGLWTCHANSDSFADHQRFGVCMDDNWTYQDYYGVQWSEFVPVVDAFVFFRYSIDQTKSLLQSLSSSHGTTNGGTSTTNPNAAGAWYSSTSHLGGGPGSTTYPDYSRPYQVDADLPGKPSAGGPLAGPFHSYPAAPAPRNIEYAPYPVPPEGAVAYPMPAAGGRQVHGNALFPSLSRNKEPSMAISQPMTRYNVQSGTNGAQLVRSLSQSRRDSAANVRPGAPAGSYHF